MTYRPGPPLTVAAFVFACAALATLSVFCVAVAVLLLAAAGVSEITHVYQRQAGLRRVMEGIDEVLGDVHDHLEELDRRDT